MEVRQRLAKIHALGEQLEKELKALGEVQVIPQKSFKSVFYYGRMKDTIAQLNKDIEQFNRDFIALHNRIGGE